MVFKFKWFLWIYEVNYVVCIFGLLTVIATFLGFNLNLPNCVYLALRRSVRSSLHINPKKLRIYSALRVAKVVLNTQCYQYHWLTM